MRIRIKLFFYLNVDPDKDLDQGIQTNANPDPGQALKSQKDEFLHEKYPLSR
jgi:hypothetical protein